MKKILFVLICTIAVVFLFVAGKTAILPYLVQDANYGIPSLEKHGADTLFIGSSMFRQGIDTKELNSEDHTTYLLAYNGLQPYAELVTLDEVLDHIEIRTLVIDMYVYSLAAQPGMSDIRLFQGMPVSFINRLFSHMKKYGDSDCFDLFEMVVQSNNEMLLSWPVSYPLINSRYYRGSNVSKASGKTAENLEKEQVDLPSELHLDGHQEEALGEIIDLCLSKNIKIVFVETPKYMKLYDDNAYVDGFQQYLDLLKGKDVDILISNYTAERCQIDESVTTYDFNSSEPSFFTDLLHLSAAGRGELSESLMRILSE